MNSFTARVTDHPNTCESVTLIQVLSSVPSLPPSLSPFDTSLYCLLQLESSRAKMQEPDGRSVPLDAHFHSTPLTIQRFLNSAATFHLLG